MHVADHRYTFLGSHHGHEWLCLNLREADALRRASKILNRLRAQRAEEFHARGYAPTLELASDLADDSDSLTLASAAAYIDELLEECVRSGEDLAGRGLQSVEPRGFALELPARLRAKQEAT